MNIKKCEICLIKEINIRKKYCDDCQIKKSKESARERRKEVLSPYLHKDGLEWLEREKEKKR